MKVDWHFDILAVEDLPDLSRYKKDMAWWLHKGVDWKIVADIGSDIVRKIGPIADMEEYVQATKSYGLSNQNLYSLDSLFTVPICIASGTVYNGGHRSFIIREAGARYLPLEC